MGLILAAAFPKRPAQTLQIVGILYTLSYVTRGVRAGTRRPRDQFGVSGLDSGNAFLSGLDSRNAFPPPRSICATSGRNVAHVTRSGAVAVVRRRKTLHDLPRPLPARSGNRREEAETAVKQRVARTGRVFAYINRKIMEFATEPDPRTLVELRNETVWLRIGGALAIPTIRRWSIR